MVTKNIDQRLKDYLAGDKKNFGQKKGRAMGAVYEEEEEEEAEAAAAAE